MIEKILLHILLNIRLYFHITCIFFLFLWNYILYALTGIPFFDIILTISVIIIYPINELYYEKNIRKGAEDLIKEYRMRDLD
jgi:hypothetical protein